MNYGTWTTIDVPTKNEAEALEFLQTKFEAIGGYVYKKNNPHDFGTYPSFEVNKPSKFEYIDEDLDCDCFNGDCEDCLELVAHDKWIDQANEIETSYSKKFEKWL